MISQIERIRIYYETLSIHNGIHWKMVKKADALTNRSAKVAWLFFPYFANILLEYV